MVLKQYLPPIDSIILDNIKFDRGLQIVDIENFELSDKRPKTANLVFV